MFKNKQGATISATPLAGIPVKAAADASGGRSGALVITQPAVFALKVLQPVPQGGFQTASLTPARPRRLVSPQGLAAVTQPAAPEPPMPLRLGGRSIVALGGLAVH